MQVSVSLTAASAASIDDLPSPRVNNQHNQKANKIPTATSLPRKLDGQHLGVSYTDNRKTWHDDHRSLRLVPLFKL